MTFLDQKRPDLQTWTDERVELLKKLWADGLSASQIAGELGGITRNAVIGKVHRLGLSGRAKAPSSSVPRQRKPRAPSMFRAPRPMMRGNTALAMPAYDYEPEPEPELLENIIPIGQRCTLLELDSEKCHWPIGDPGEPEFHFCGRKTCGQLPYCEHHARMAYQPVQMRRRERRFANG
jgi:GcrA cell cycle regulator